MIRSGEPSFESPPRVVREVKFGGDNGPRPERDTTDFALKSQVIELVRQLRKLGDATVAVLEVKNGLPFKMEVAATIR